MKNTPLSAVHEKMGARMVEFAGFAMPVQYTSIIEEHQAVRTQAGLFDLYHMGEFWITGPDALKNVQKLITQDAELLSDRQIAYSPMCRPDGSIVDDLLCYRFSADRFLLVVNASNMQKDLEWVKSQLSGKVEFEDKSEKTGLIAIQGPNAQDILQKLTRQNLKAIKYYWFTTGEVKGVNCIISRTGYTGEDGFELYFDAEHCATLWNALLEAGKDKGLKAIGLGARDTLRLEARLMLYGNDIHDGTNPIEANLDWTVKFGKGSFNGYDVLKKQKEQGTVKTLVGFEMGPGPAPRHGYAIFKDGKKVGEVTSGTMSPTLKKNIGLGYVPPTLKEIGSTFDVEVRGKMIPAIVIPTPFYNRPAAASAAGKPVQLKDSLKNVDAKTLEILKHEARRQMSQIELIASENFVSNAVLEAQGSVLTNKYAEGYPAKRYYGGCEVVDQAENLARDRAKQLFGAEHANVQPHSGSQANMAVYMTVMKPGDTYLGMNLQNGGHLTHGSPVNFSGMLYKCVPYGVDEKSETIDYNAVEKLAKEHQPKLIMIGASAYPRIIDFERFRRICDEVKAVMVVDMAHIAGLVAAGLHPSPVPYADFVTTTTHKTLRGPRGGMILCKEPYAKAIDKTIFPGIQGGPLMHVIAAKAVAFEEALQPAFKEYQKRVLENAKALAEGLTKRGFRLVSGGTDNHLMLVDMRPKKITGKVAEAALDKAGITVNKNTIPNDPESPFVTSGLRLGSPAVTTRGFDAKTMDEVADLIDQVVKAPADEANLKQVREKVLAICGRFPFYPEFLMK